MTESQMAGTIMLVIGGLNAVRPDILISFQVWMQRTLMKAKYEPSERTYKVTRVTGALICVLGFLAITGAIK